jgi:hypothetical protein
MPWIDDLKKCEEFAVKAMDNKGYREAISYLRRLMESCPDSVKHFCFYLEALVSTNPNDMTDPISFATKV